MTCVKQVAEVARLNDSEFPSFHNGKGLRMRILLAVDESEYSEAAAELAAAQIRPEGAEVLIVHIMYPMVDMAEHRKQLSRSHEIVERTAQVMNRAGFATETDIIIVDEGDIRDAILQLATKWHADLIVLGAHGSKGVRHFLLGNVSENVARHAACSVLIVRPPSPR
ncbi:MAG: universal stress protein [Nitrososphaerales archaeon]